MQVIFSCHGIFGYIEVLVEGGIPHAYIFLVGICFAKLIIAVGLVYHNNDLGYESFGFNLGFDVRIATDIGCFVVG